MSISVIIPTYNRPDALNACLESLAAQRIDTPWDVAVWNDGGDTSARDVTERQRNAGFPAPLTYDDPGHLGPSAIRNRALSRATGQIILLLNDDVTFGPDHLAHHLARHRTKPGHAARGLTRWAPEHSGPPSAFMGWVTRQSFFYYLVHDREDIGYEYWHTCDLSIGRQWVTGARAFLFDEEFPHAGYEDTEWGWRLEEAGCRLALLPEAVSWHHHHYSAEGLVARGRRNGESAAVMLLKVPALRGRAIDDFLLDPDAPPVPLPDDAPLLARLRRPMGNLRRRWKRGRATDNDTATDHTLLGWHRAYLDAYLEGFHVEFRRRMGRWYQGPGDTLE